MNIYVGNLQYGLNEDELKSVFEEYGAVESAKIISDRETGRSKGFGFVEMSDDSAAQEAINDLDGAEVSGRAMRVSEARPRNNSRGNSFR
ncbi:MAG: RNA-binding protein [Bacteroidetes bacterium]|jgi:RNA recognition motif-containing protein|nr:RNA-binding protein [Bacteroidota bacterium]